MPKLSRMFIKAGFLYLLFSLILIGFIKIHAVFYIWEYLNYCTPVFYHGLMVGWVTQMIMGVSLWMFPRHSRQQPRGNETVGWFVFYGINIGLFLRVISEPFISLHPHLLWSIMMLVSILAQCAAGILYIVNIWPRIKLK